MKETLSLILAKKYLGKYVKVEIDRPLGSKHPKHGFLYEANYGYIPDTKAPDGGELDAYYLGLRKPIDKGKGMVIAIIHRVNDDDDKVVVAPKGIKLSDEQISKLVHFQEKWFEYKIIR